MTNFHLFVLGESFDVDACLRHTSLRPTRIWRRSEPGGPRFKSCPTSGFAIELGDASKLSINDQQHIASEFLETYANQLKAVAEFPGATTRTLRIHVAINEQSGLGFCVSPSPALMWHALHVRFDIDFFLQIANETHQRLTSPFIPAVPGEPSTPLLATATAIIESPKDFDRANAIHNLVIDRLRNAVANAIGDIPAVHPTVGISIDALDPATSNCARCIRCGQWMSDLSKPDLFHGLPMGTLVNGQPICDQCQTSENSSGDEV